ncbi:hypothetical protein HanIR_Chr09g0416901 [Helianthus annuus]|nr:hypothetical protein HanIR_Chr09g0416901 [Helianthus annuus]
MIKFDFASANKSKLVLDGLELILLISSIRGKLFAFFLICSNIFSPVGILDRMCLSGSLDSSHGLKPSVRSKNSSVSLSASCLSRVRFLIRLNVSSDGGYSVVGLAANEGKLLAFSRMWSKMVLSVTILQSSSSATATAAASSSS